MEVDAHGWSLVEESITALADYGQIPISFSVDRRFEVAAIDGGLGGIVLRERSVDRPYIKDYDALEGAEPARWAELWDLANWGFISAYCRGNGSAALSWPTIRRASKCSRAGRTWPSFGIFASIRASADNGSAKRSFWHRRTGLGRGDAAGSRSKRKISTSQPAGSTPSKGVS